MAQKVDNGLSADSHDGYANDCRPGQNRGSDVRLRRICSPVSYSTFIGPLDLLQLETHNPTSITPEHRRPAVQCEPTQNKTSAYPTIDDFIGLLHLPSRHIETWFRGDSDIRLCTRLACVCLRGSQPKQLLDIFQPAPVHLGRGSRKSSKGAAYLSCFHPARVAINASTLSITINANARV